MSANRKYSGRPPALRLVVSRSLNATRTGIKGHDSRTFSILYFPHKFQRPQRSNRAEASAFSVTGWEGPWDTPAWHERQLSAGPAIHKKSASLRQHTLDDQPFCGNTGNVMAVSPGTSGLECRSLTTDIDDVGGNDGALAQKTALQFRFPDYPMFRSPDLLGLLALLYNGFRSATPSATVLSAIYAACSM